MYFPELYYHLLILLILQVHSKIAYLLYIHLIHFVIELFSDFDRLRYLLLVHKPEYMYRPIRLNNLRNKENILYHLQFEGIRHHLWWVN